MESLGRAGRAWLAALPVILAEVSELWDLEVGRPYEGGAVAFVAPAERSDLYKVVLKISILEDETRAEPDALAVWNGDGAVRLLEVDRARGAMLLERLEPGTSLNAHPDRDEAISVACELLRRLWRPVPETHPFPLVRDLALRLSAELPAEFERLGRPFERPLIDEAVELSEEMAGSEEPIGLANRDFHLGNVLAAEREPWLLIDPKPLVGERAFDCGHLLLSLVERDPDPHQMHKLVDRLAEDLALDGGRIRAWGLIRAVDNGLWGLDCGLPEPEWDIACARALSDFASTAPLGFP
jgi:streptomycin 6-kinase